MILSYDNIFSSFLSNITDLNFTQMNESDANAIMTELLHKSIGDTYIFTLFDSSTLELDDLIQQMKCNMAISVNDVVDEAFVVSLLGKRMAIEWLRPQYLSHLNIKQVFTNKEQKFYSQSTHTAGIETMYKSMISEVNHMINHRNSFYNEYLQD